MEFTPQTMAAAMTLLEMMRDPGALEAQMAVFDAKIKELNDLQQLKQDLAGQRADLDRDILKWRADLAELSKQRDAFADLQLSVMAQKVENEKRQAALKEGDRDQQHRLAQLIPREEALDRRDKALEIKEKEAADIKRDYEERLARIKTLAA